MFAASFITKIKKVMDNIKFINLTPHAVKIANANGDIILDVPSSANDYPALRAIQDNSNRLFDAGNIPVVKAQFGGATFVPPKIDGTYYIVSSIAAQALAVDAPDRADFVVPDTGDDCIRDAQGRPFAALRFLSYAATNK